MTNSLYKYFALILIIGLILSCSDDDTSGSNNNTNNGTENFLQVMEGDAELSMFLDAIDKTGLNGSFGSDGSMTLFAPTNTVFGAYLSDLGYSSVDAWLTVVDADIAQQILLYHLLETSFMMDELATGYVKTTASNDDGFALDIFINTSSGITLNGSSTEVTSGDIEASNGIIHKISSVLQPQTIGAFILNNNDFFDLRTASNLASGDIVTTLSEANTSFTMMAANNSAFNQYYSEQTNISNVVEMINELGASDVQDVLEYHILLGSIRSDNFQTQTYDTRLNGFTQSINTSGGNLSITDGEGRQAFFFFKDVTATNGTLHVISNVLIN